MRLCEVKVEGITSLVCLSTKLVKPVSTTIYPYLEREKSIHIKDISVKCKPPHPGFELDLPSPFSLIMIMYSSTKSWYLGCHFLCSWGVPGLQDMLLCVVLVKHY